jgi:hypothetical protein
MPTGMAELRHACVRRRAELCECADDGVAAANVLVAGHVVGVGGVITCRSEQDLQMCLAVFLSDT